MASRIHGWNAIHVSEPESATIAWENRALSLAVLLARGARELLACGLENKMRMNKIGNFAVMSFLTVFMLVWIDLLPSWMIALSMLQSIPLFAWANDLEESR
jgi:hypothetical protein